MHQHPENGFETHFGVRYVLATLLAKFHWAVQLLACYKQPLRYWVLCGLNGLSVLIRTQARLFLAVKVLFIDKRRVVPPCGLMGNVLVGLLSTYIKIKWRRRCLAMSDTQSKSKYWCGFLSTVMVQRLSLLKTPLAGSIVRAPRTTSLNVLLITCLWKTELVCTTMNLTK